MSHLWRKYTYTYYVMVRLFKCFLYQGTFKKQVLDWYLTKFNLDSGNACFEKEYQCLE